MYAMHVKLIVIIVHQSAIVINASLTTIFTKIYVMIIVHQVFYIFFLNLNN